MAQEQAARRIRHIFDAIQGSRTLEGVVCSALCRAEETENVINKVCTADEAVALIKDGDMVTVRTLVMGQVCFGAPNVYQWQHKACSSSVMRAGLGSRNPARVPDAVNSVSGECPKPTSAVVVGPRQREFVYPSYSSVHTNGFTDGWICGQ